MYYAMSISSVLRRNRDLKRNLPLCDKLRLRNKNTIVGDPHCNFVETLQVYSFILYFFS